MNLNEDCTAAEIIDFVTRAAKKIAEHYEPGRLPSGYLTILSPEDGQILLLAPIGKGPADKFVSWRRNSIEKAERLHAHPGHVSSWQSRDFPNKKYGGSIRAKYIVSFSGLPEHADEALCIATAIRFDWIDSERPMQILVASDNKRGYEALQLAA